MDSLKAEHQQQVDGLQASLAEKDTQISQKDARIAELQTALDAAIAKASEEAPAGVQVDADPSNSPEGQAPAKNFDEAVAACKEFLNRNNN